MLAIEVSIIPLGITVVSAFAVGFLLRGSQLKSHRKRILHLEKEMLRNHADILDLQKEKADLLRQIKDTDSRVIPITKSPKEEGEKSGNVQAK